MTIRLRLVGSGGAVARVGNAQSVSQAHEYVGDLFVRTLAKFLDDLAQ